MGLGESAANGFPPVRQQELWRGSCCRPRKTLRHPDTPEEKSSLSLQDKRYSKSCVRIIQDITTIPIHFSAKNNAQAHNMTVLRISSYHAGKISDYSEKQLHKMSFYLENVIICGENERAAQEGSGIRGRDGGFCGRKNGVMSKFSPAQPGLARKTSQ